MDHISIEEGQKVWVWTTRGIKETYIQGIGRKYVTLEYNPKVKFHLNTLREVNGVGEVSFIILDLEKYKEEVHCKESKSTLRTFNWDKVSAEDLNKIISILDKYL